MKTEIIFILDRSGSMQSCAKDAVGGFNTFLKEHQKEPKGKRLTLLQFDHKLIYTYTSKKIKKCTPLVNGETYQPRGSTSLLDAIGTGINRLKDSKKAIVIIYTDGQENTSWEWSPDGVKDLIKQVVKKGWQVDFLAADVDTTFATQALGMSKRNVAGGASVGLAMASSATRSMAYAKTGLVSGSSLQDDYDSEKNK